MRTNLLCAFAFVCLWGAVAISAQPSIEWQRCLGGSRGDVAYSIQQTADGGFIVAGWTASSDGDVSGWHEGYDDYDGTPLPDSWLVKLDSAGNIIWQKSLGGSDSDWAHSIQQTADGGFIVAGESHSNNGDVSGWHEGYDHYGYHTSDYWIVKLDSAGEIEWQKCLGGSDDDFARSIQQTADGGYIVAGYSASNDGDVSGHHPGGCGDPDGIWYEYPDCWIVKLNSAGEIEWQKILGGSRDDWAYSIQQTTDGGYIVAGCSRSNDGDVSGHHGRTDYPDFWIVKLNSAGEIEWQKTLGGSRDDWAYSIQQTTDGGFIVAGWSSSNDGDISGNHGRTDFWVVKLNSTGDIEWQRCLGGTADDGAHSIQQTADGGFIVAGGSCSNDGDVSGNHGGWDFWIVKLSPEEKIAEDSTIPEQFAINIFPNPFNSSFEIAVPAWAEIEIYDLECNIVHKPATSGTQIIWTPGKSVPSGVYLVRAVSPDGNSEVKRVVYMK